MQKSTGSIYKTLFRPKLILLSLFITFILTFLVVYLNFFKQPDIEVIASSIEEQCRVADSVNCVANLLYKFAKTNKFTTTHAVLADLKKINPSIRYCHKIAHLISIAEVEKKPEAWLDVFGAVPPDECSYGFFHGVIEGAFQTNPDLKINSFLADSICNEGLIAKTGFVRSERSCAHAFGHIFLVQKEGIVASAIDECSHTAERIKKPCYQGVFMEHIQKNNLSDHGVETRPDWTKDYFEKEKEICEGFFVDNRDECWQSLGPLINSISKQNRLDAVSYCDQAVLDSSKRVCAREVLGQLLVDDFSSNIEVKIDYCDFKQNFDQYNDCLNDIISYVLLTSDDFSDQMMKYCLVVRQEARNECLQEVNKY